MSHITAALIVVANDSHITHLATSSPAIPGCRPGDRDVLCGAAFATDSLRPIVEVDCGDCLLASQPFWELPSWTEEVYQT